VNRLLVVDSALTTHALIATLWSAGIPALAEVESAPSARSRQQACRDFGVAWVDLSAEPPDRVLQRLAVGVRRMPVAVAVADQERFRRWAGTHRTLGRALALTGREGPAVATIDRPATGAEDRLRS
jgi:hypothetical protein